MGLLPDDLRYRGYRILSGKYGLSGLPAVYGAEKEAQTLEVVLEDGRTGIQVTLLYGVLPKYDVITRRCADHQYKREHHLS